MRDSIEFENYVLGGCIKPKYASTDDSQMSDLYCFKNIENGKEYSVTINEPGDYVFVYDLHINADELAQWWCSVTFNGKKVDEMSMCGTNGKSVQLKQPVKLESGNFTMVVGADKKFVVEKLAIKH